LLRFIYLHFHFYVIQNDCGTTSFYYGKFNPQFIG
jgi:hypothetical protein